MIGEGQWTMDSVGKAAHTGMGIGRCKIGGIPQGLETSEYLLTVAKQRLIPQLKCHSKDSLMSESTVSLFSSSTVE